MIDTDANFEAVDCAWYMISSSPRSSGIAFKEVDADDDVDVDGGDDEIEGKDLFDLNTSWFCNCNAFWT